MKKTLFILSFLFLTNLLHAQSSRKFGVGVAGPLAVSIDYQLHPRLGIVASVLPAEDYQGGELILRAHIVKMKRSDVILSAHGGYLKTKSGFDGITYAGSIGLDWNWGKLTHVKLLNNLKSNLMLVVGQSEASLSINGGIYYLLK